MNKLEVTMVAVLVAALVGWGFYSRKNAPPPTDKTAVTATNAPSVTLPSDTALSASSGTVTTATNALPAALPKPAAPSVPERTVTLSNSNLNLTVSSRGGGIVSAQFNQYRAELDRASDPLVMDFRDVPALSFRGDAFDGGDFDVQASADGRSVSVTRSLAGGLRLARTVTLDDTYRLSVQDVFTNDTAQAIKLPGYGLGVGPMRVDDPKTRAADLAFLGLDSLAAHGGDGVHFWLKRTLWGKSALIKKCAEVEKGGGTLPPSITYETADPVLWTASKSKFFVQILYAGEDTAGAQLTAWYDAAEPRRAVVSQVSGAVLMPAAALEPHGSLVREASYYVGPKKYNLLKQLGNRQDEVMDLGGWFGWFGWICKMLIPLLNWIYAVIPSYGIAVILLTVIVRALFWPITQKSTQSMKRMAELQPLVAQIREKFKDKPDKMNQEMMALYREHKVNPMSGCLPMLVQIPVFIALFTVLQSAVELRFAPFLWIKDLSEPENLLLGVLPFGLGLNLLPLFMTGLTLWQQKLTPSGGDPQQQKIMMWMPVIFLFMFYKMASALVLYWSVSQLLSIVQMLMQRRKTAGKTPVGPVVAAAKGKRGR
jgi:YidC/Oxa1 family membrane protein insertase